MVVIGILSAVESVPSGVAGRIRSWRAGLLQSPDEELNRSRLWSVRHVRSVLRLTEFAGNAQVEVCPRVRSNGARTPRTSFECRIGGEGYPLGNIFRPHERLRERQPASEEARQVSEPAEPRSDLVRYRSLAEVGAGDSERTGIDVAAFKGIPMYQVHP